MSNTTTDYDVIVIGGGPGGAAMGAYLGRAGVRCLVMEREIFPRPHVGESLVPSSSRVFDDLGFTQTLDAAGFPKKYGALWTAPAGKHQYAHDWDGLVPHECADVRFEERVQPGVMRNYTFHVDRAKFDLLMLKHAETLGAQVVQGLRVVSVDFEDPTKVRVHYCVGAHQSSLSCKIVVDASGRKTLLGQQLALRQRDPVFQQFAVHTWFRGLDRGQDKFRDYIHVHFLPLRDSWVWQIPITEDTTSIGLVTHKSNFAKSRKQREEFFWDTVALREDFGARLRAAEQLRPFVEEGDYSYSMREITGDRFVLIGDAARFVDPIFSSGVSIALNSARFAKDDILDALRAENYAKSAFQNYEKVLRAGTRNWHDFITLYYRLNVLFTAFVRDERYRVDVLKLLQGDVYDEARPAVLVEMERRVKEIEDNPDHLWHGLLNNLRVAPENAPSVLANP